MTDREQEARAEAGSRYRWWADREAFVAGVAWADAHRPTEPDEDNWEYGTVSEITPAQVINTGHVDYWRSRGYDIIRRRRASEWEPVTPRGEQP